MPPAIDRRSGTDRRRDAGSDEPSAGTALIGRWPLVVGSGFDAARPHDPWVAIVHRSIADYRAGRFEAARQCWDERISWVVPGREITVGPEAILERHRRLEEATDGTFRQALVSLDGSSGPIVEAHVRTAARRAGRTLDIPSLIVFELAAMRIRNVTEIPGDQAAWDSFWAD